MIIKEHYNHYNKKYNPWKPIYGKYTKSAANSILKEIEDRASPLRNGNSTGPFAYGMS
ncbi:MAG TPA: hypothetical protein PLA91_05705 [Bacillota bacterium]|jgi:hypothetical protein|nr:hypothetical protein [Bacillota bacterium]